MDVTVIPSGLYRDLFPNLMLLLDQAVNVVKTDTNADNPLLRNIAAARAELEAQGVAPAEAERFASVRLFSVPSGTYGAGLDHAIQQADSWTNEQQVAGVFFNRMSHLFGQGFWGTRAAAGTNADLSPTLLRLALKGAKGVVHSRSSNVYGAIDSDDFYQYLGGTAMAVREVNGKPAETLVTDLSNPNAGETMTLERYMGREMRARYLNPKWIEAMLKEGYAGARMIRQVTDNLWGWQVTVPDAVGEAKWQEMFETYVQDRHALGIREKFKAAENLAAYQGDGGSDAHRHRKGLLASVAGNHCPFETGANRTRPRRRCGKRNHRQTRRSAAWPCARRDPASHAQRNSGGKIHARRKRSGAGRKAAHRDTCTRQRQELVSYFRCQRDSLSSL